MTGNKLVAVAVLSVLAAAWIALMWFFNLYDEFWWNVLSVAVVIPLLLWASAKSRTPRETDNLDADNE